MCSPLSHGAPRSSQGILCKASHGNRFTCYKCNEEYGPVERWVAQDSKECYCFTCVPKLELSEDFEPESETIFVDVTPSPGEESTSKYPFNSYYTARRQQVLYLAADIKAASRKYEDLATILAIQLKVDKPPELDLHNFRLEYAFTTEEEIESEWHDTTLVFGPKTLSHDGLLPDAWTTFELDTPIEWDGCSNIIFQVCLSTCSCFCFD